MILLSSTFDKHKLRLRLSSLSARLAKFAGFVCPLLLLAPMIVVPVRNLLEALLPQLEKAEEERLQKEETLKQQEAERKKMGPPEDMTVRLLKEVLDDLNINL